VTVYREHKVKGENQQDATNSMFIIKLLCRHVSGIIMPITRRIRPCPTACGVLPGCVGFLVLHAFTWPIIKSIVSASPLFVTRHTLT